MRHHQEADGLHAEVAGKPEMLDGHVGLGAMRGDPGDASTDVARSAKIVLGADARHQENGDRGLGGLLDTCPDQGQLVLAGEAVVERRAAQPVPVRYLDDGHAGSVQRVHGGADLGLGELVRHRVAAVAQRRIGDPQLAPGSG